MTTELEGLVSEARDRQIWYAFFVSHRDVLNCEANKILLDNFLTAELKVLSVESLDEAYNATKGQLAKRHPSVPSQVRVEPTTVVTPIPAVEVYTGPDKDTPVEYTRKRIMRMEKEEYRALLKKYGDLAIQTRVNRREAQ